MWITNIKTVGAGEKTNRRARLAIDNFMSICRLIHATGQLLQKTIKTSAERKRKANSIRRSAEHTTLKIEISSPLLLLLFLLLLLLPASPKLAFSNQIEVTFFSHVFSHLLCPIWNIAQIATGLNFFVGGRERLHGSQMA